MTEITYNDVNIAVPQSWDDITLGEWDVLHKLKPRSNRERVAFVAQLCKIDAEDLLRWPSEVFNVLVSHTRFVFERNPATPAPSIEIDGTRYVIAVEDRLTLGEWIDADEVQKAGDAVLSNLLAIVCRPAGETYDYLNNDARRGMFAALPLSKVLPLLGFFLQCREQSQKLTRTFLQLAAVADLLPPSTEILRRLTGGIKWWRIWPMVKYSISTALLRYRLRKLSAIYGIPATGSQRKTRNDS